MKTLNQIAAALEGYDPQALRTEVAAEFLLQLAQPVTDIESLPLLQSLGRVLAHDVISPVNVPPHDNSAMDGFAFNGAFLHGQAQTGAGAGSSTGTGGPLQLKVVGTALAGRTWRATVGAGECVKITTGAVMPEGLDTVIPVELVQAAGDWIGFEPQAVRSGDNRRQQGEDIRRGSAALEAGSLITPAALGLLASLGLPEVQVLRRLKVAYFSTGDEILSLGQTPREGAVFDSNRYTLYGLLTAMGVQVLDRGVVGDDPSALEAALVRAASEADAIITSGGVSMGEADHTKTVLQKLGDVAFWKIAIRPGRPMAVGQIIYAKSGSSPHGTCASSYENSSGESSTAPQRPTLLLGLPGNPVAVMVTFLALVRPALLKMMGRKASAPVLLQAHSTQAIRKKPGRTEYQRGIVSTAADGRLQVQSTGNQGSGVLSSMVQANGLMVLHHDQGNVAPGDVVSVLMLDAGA